MTALNNAMFNAQKGATLGINETIPRSLNTDICSLHVGNVFEQEGDVLVIPFYNGDAFDPGSLIEQVKVHAGDGFQRNLIADMAYEPERQPNQVTLSFSGYDLNHKFKKIFVPVMDKNAESLCVGLNQAINLSAFMYPDGEVVIPFLGYSFLTLDEQIEVLHEVLQKSGQSLHILDQISIFIDKATAESETVKNLIHSAIAPMFWSGELENE